MKVYIFNMEVSGTTELTAPVTKAFAVVADGLKFAEGCLVESMTGKVHNAPRLVTAFSTPDTTHGFMEVIELTPDVLEFSGKDPTK